MAKKIRILHVVSELNVGGIESMIYNYYRYIDKGNFIFDFIVHGQNVGMIEQLFNAMGSKVYHVPPKKEGIIRYIKEIIKIIKNNDYEIIHVHQSLMSFIPLYLGKKNGIQIRIAHSHGNNISTAGIKKYVDPILSLLTTMSSNYWFACGLKAGEWVFGKQKVIQDKVVIVKNAIDLEKYAYSVGKRKTLRRELELDDKLVVAQIGRFTYEKNHNFTVDIIEGLVKVHPEIVFLFIGDGALMEEIKNKVNSMKLTNYVRFMGNCNNVSDLLSAIDILLLPSLHEGLPLTPIEAQANGLKCIVSKQVTSEVQITDLISFADISSKQEWINMVVENSTYYERLDYSRELTLGGYNIVSAANNLQKLYEEMIRDKIDKEFFA